MIKLNFIFRFFKKSDLIAPFTAGARIEREDGSLIQLHVDEDLLLESGEWQQQVVISVIRGWWGEDRKGGVQLLPDNNLSESKMGEHSFLREDLYGLIDLTTTIKQWTA